MLTAVDTKVCSCCKIEKILSEYHKDKSRNDGYQYQCKSCKSDKHKEYRQTNRDRIVEKDKAYRQANRDIIAERKKEYRQANLDKYRSFAAKRRAIRYQACPMWARVGTYKKQIDSVYREARRLEKQTGIPYHVDHIIPLQPPKVTLFEGELIPLVCGLHVPANLRAIPYDLNLSKSNAFEPYIESELKCRHTA